MSKIFSQLGSSDHSFALSLLLVGDMKFESSPPAFCATRRCASRIELASADASFDDASAAAAVTFESPTADDAVDEITPSTPRASATFDAMNADADLPPPSPSSSPPPSSSTGEFPWTDFHPRPFFDGPVRG